MIDNPCNCSTCDNPKCPLPRYFNGRLEKFVPGQMINPSKIVGCLSHPQAREHLNADAIKELQQLVDDPLIVPTARLCFEKAMVLMREGKS